MAKVQILLSTYDGQRFVDQQLASILNQNGVLVEILARDDGSHDSTQRILKRWAQSEPRLTFVEGGNCGPAMSFLALLRDSDAHADYFAFADQDDVWHPDKLRTAVEYLSPVSACPAMFFSRLEVVDERLQHLGYFPAPRHVGLTNALVQNVIPGCSMVFNKAARDFLVSALPEKCLMHDWWVYLVMSCVGKCVYCDEPLVMYRQHGHNAVGVPSGVVGSWISKAKRVFAKQSAGRCTDQAREVLAVCGDRLDVGARHMIEQFVLSRRTVWSRLKYACGNNVRRQALVDNVILSALIVLGRY